MRPRVILVIALLSVAVAGPALAGFAGTDVFLPMVGRNVGVYPSNWYTTVWIYNPGASMVTARLYFLERSKVNLSAPWVDVTVAAGATEKLENPVEALFHLQVFGAFRVTAPEKIVVTSRVYSKVAGAGEQESMGQDFAGVPASFAIGLNEKSQILGCYETLPRADSEYRYNFGFVETTGHQATVKVTARDDAGIERGTTSILVREYSQKQMAFKDYFPSLSTENTRLEIEVVSGEGKVIGYGSGIANGSQDPTTYEMTYSDTHFGMMPVQHDATLVGDGTASALLGLADGAVSQQKLAASGGAAGQVLGTNGSALQWQNDGLKLPYSGSANTTSAAFTLSNSGAGGMGLQITSASGAPGSNAPTIFAQNSSSGTMGWLADRERGVWGMSPTGNGVVGWSQSAGYGVFGVLGSSASITPLGLGAVAGSSTFATGVVGTSDAGEGVRGESHNSYGLHGKSTLFDGVFGEASATDKAGVRGVNSNPAGWAGYFAGKVAITGDLDCTGCVGAANIAAGAVAKEQLANGAVTVDKMSATGSTSGQIPMSSGQAVSWQTLPGLSLPYHGSVTLPGAALIVENFGTGGTAINGSSEWGGTGVFGSAGGGANVLFAPAGVIGSAHGVTGVSGASTDGWGVAGLSEHNNGVLGRSTGANGVQGESAGSNWSGVYGVNSNASGFGVFGRNSSRNTTGYLGGDFGASGVSERFQGWLGYSDGGVLGKDITSGNYGYLGMASYAGYFSGPVRVSGLGGGGAVYADANGVLTLTPSNAGLKRDVVTLSDEIEVTSVLARLRGVAFNWDSAAGGAHRFGDRREIGMIAQEVEAVLPQVVSAGAEGFETLDYAKLTALLIEVAKAQQREIEELKEAVAELRR